MMKTFVVQLSDAAGIDAKLAVEVQDELDLGRAAQLALDGLVEEHGRKLTFPIFVDIHPATEFQGREWMHAKTEPSRTPAWSA